MAGLDPFSEAHFGKFNKQLANVIAKYGITKETDLLEMQRNQVEKLVGLEELFRSTLNEGEYAEVAYLAFLDHVKNIRKNILSARPYFRERQTIFTESISPALKKQEHMAIKNFHYNYTLILLLVNKNLWPKDHELNKICKEIEKIRNELIEMNTPLAINRARIFWSRTPKSHLAYMDLVQICAEGLVAAVDKFVLPYTPVFRSVAIGRMVGNLIDQYSATMLHFWPGDRRKIYRANKFAGRHGQEIDVNKMVEAINDGVTKAYTTDPVEIGDLLAAASTVSGHAPVRSVAVDSAETVELLDVVTDESYTPEEKAEENEAFTLIGEAIAKLPLIEQKILRLRGINLENMF